MTTNHIVSIQEDTNFQLEVAMQAVEKAMIKAVSSEVTVLQDASRHILGAGGKRIRPRLTMLVYLALGGTDVDYVAPAAASVELMHTASVVHDDINDHGAVRRGRPSVNAIWGRTFALLTGDFLFTAVYQMMSPYKELNILLAKAATALVEGETLQAQAVKENTFTRDVYTRIIGLKTAALFQASGEIGARLANATTEQVDAVATFAYNVGLAFQIVDDILDVIGDETTLGKTSGIDLQQGRGFGAIQEKPATDTDVMDKVKRKFLEGDYLTEARQQAQMLIELGIAMLDVIPSSPAKDELILLAHAVTNRDH